MDEVLNGFPIAEFCIAAFVWAASEAGDKAAQHLAGLESIWRRLLYADDVVVTVKLKIPKRCQHSFFDRISSER